MTSPLDFEANTIAMYQAIGHYTVEFATLVSSMRDVLASHCTNHAMPALPFIVMGEMTAQPMANSFFGACRRVTLLTEDEQAVERRLRRNVNDTIKRRNDLVHGDWLINAHRLAIAPTGSSQLFRLRPNRMADYVEETEIRPEDLEDEANGVNELAAFVFAFGHVCFKSRGYEDTRVGDVLELRDNQVVRTVRLG